MQQNERSPAGIEDLMTTEPIMIEPSDKIGRARDMMLTLRIHALPVIGQSEEIVGIVTSTDLVDDWADDELIASVMTSVPFMIDVETGIREAAECMIERRVHHLLVERSGQLIGILSSLDLLDALVAVPDP